MGNHRTIRAMLTGGDRRSIGMADEVADRIRLDSKQAASLTKCLWDHDPCVRMRAADALEKAARDNPNLLQPFKAELFGLSAETHQSDLRWHLAVMIPRMRLTASECRRVAVLLQRYLMDESSIVKTFAMQGLYDLTLQDAGLRPVVMDRLRALTLSGTPAMRARGRILIRQMETP